MSLDLRSQNGFCRSGYKSALAVAGVIAVALTCMSCTTVPITAVSPSMTQDIALRRIKALFSHYQYPPRSEGGVSAKREDIEARWALNPRVINEQGWEEFIYVKESERLLSSSSRVDVRSAMFSRALLRYKDIMEVKRKIDTVYITMRDETKLIYAYSHGPSNPFRASREMQETAEAFEYMRQHAVGAP